LTKPPSDPNPPGGIELSQRAAGFGMAVFIAVVKTDGEAGYTASFPDFPQIAVDGPTLDEVIARAGETLTVHIERLLEANQTIGIPTPAEAIEQGDALLLAAIDIPDDLRIAHIDLAIPALSLARIDSFARRHGLTRSALFVQAVNRWAAQETPRRERRGGNSDGPTLFDFANPLEFKVEPIATAIDPALNAARHQSREEEAAVEAAVGDITAELVRLLEAAPQPEPAKAADDARRNRTRDKPE
jgi:predicted RNase H-like HicB family nuclease